MGAATCDNPIPTDPALLTFGLGFGLGAAGLGHSDGLLALGIVSRLLQGPLAGFGACAPITRPPGLKLVLAVGYPGEDYVIRDKIRKPVEDIVKFL